MLELKLEKFHGKLVEGGRTSAHEFAKARFKLDKTCIHRGFGHGWFTATATSSLREMGAAANSREAGGGVDNTLTIWSFFCHCLSAPASSTCGHACQIRRTA
jgi:hypothetical protein